MNPLLPRSKARTAWSVALLALLYLWIFPYHAQVNNPNENVRVYMTVAIVDDHTFAINRIERDWGYVNDKSAREVPLTEAVARRLLAPDLLAATVAPAALARVRAGHPAPEDRLHGPTVLYSSKAPGTSYLGVPVYWLLTHLTGRTSLPSHPSLAPAPGPTSPGRPAARPPPAPIDRTVVVYALRLFCNVLPALLFAWFWHRFLGVRTRSPALREAVFFGTMVGSSLFAYSEVFASHAHNAFCTGAAVMALATLRERDRAAPATTTVDPGLAALAGLFGAGATLFEYPAAVASAAVALWILATAAERRRGLLVVAAGAAGLAAAMALRHHRAAAGVAGAAAVLAYAGTLRPRGALRLLCAGAGAAVPVTLVMLYHARCFGSPFTPGYSFLENPEFRAQSAQGFYGATSFSWEAGLRLWLDPAFGLIPCTALFLFSTAGLASYLAWRPTGTLGAGVSRAAVVRALFALVLAYAAVRCVLALRVHPTDLAVPDVAAWVAATAAALLALLAVCMPRPPRDDLSMGAVMLLVLLGLTHLIGTMNNWRGGWQVGPRYLVTLIPILGITALAGLDALAAQGPWARRAATLFAGGAAVVAMLVTGLPSALFPHIPTDFTSPFFELVLPLVRDGFVPHNAGHLLGLTGLGSMAGFGVAAAGIVAVVARGDERRPVAALAHAVGAAAVAAVMLVPFALAARTESASVVRYVESAFEPRPPAESPAGAVAPPNETPDHARARARRLAETGDEPAALQAWLRAFNGAPR